MRTADTSEHRPFSCDVGPGIPAPAAEVSLSPTTDPDKGDGRHLAPGDAELVRRCRAGDSSAFATLYERHREAVRVVCRNNVTNADLVEDLVQETFSRLLVSIPTFVGGDNVVHWLRRTAKNLCIDHYRRRRNSEVPLDAAITDHAYVTPDPAVAVVMRHAVRSVLAKLRPVDAALLQDHHMAGRPLRDMARDWGSTEKSLSVRLTRARRAFAAAGSDLRALLLPVWLRLRWAGRSEPAGTAASGASMGLLHVALAVLLVVSPAAAAGEKDRAVATTPPHQVLDQQRPSVPHGGDALTGTAQDRRSDRRGPNGAQAAKRARPASGAAIAEVPGTKFRLHREAPQRPDYRYEVRVGSGAAAASAEIVVDNWDEGAAVNESSCEAVAGAPTAATCTRESD